MYKRYAEQTLEEKKYNKWLQAGRPRLVWDSSKRGTYKPNHIEEHRGIIEKTTKSFSAEYVGLPKLQAHKRKTNYKLSS